MTSSIASTTVPVATSDALLARRGHERAGAWTTVAFACAAMLACYLPFSAANGVLGTIGSRTGASTGELQWITDAFAVALAGVVLSAGVLGDLYGRKRITLVGLGFTVLGTVTGFGAAGVPGSSAVGLLWVGQAFAGIGAGLVMSCTLALVATAVAPAARSRAIAAWAACTVVGLGAGPFVSAPLVEHAGWRWLFPPITLLTAGVGIVGAWAARESSAPSGRRLDVRGQLTAAVGIVALVYGVIEGGSAGWDSPTTLVGLTVGALGLAAFVAVERRAAAPLLRPQLFASGGFTAAAIAAMAVLFTLVGVVFVLSLFFAHQGVSEFGIAVRLGFLFGANAVASLAAARLRSAVGSRAVLLAGLVIAASGLAFLLTVTGSTGLGGAAWPLMILGTGSGTTMATSSAVAVDSVPAELTGMAGAGNNALRQCGAALGAAILGAVLAARLRAGADYVAAVHTCIAIVLTLVVLTAATAALLLTRRTTRTH